MYRNSKRRVAVEVGFFIHHSASLKLHLSGPWFQNSHRVFPKIFEQRIVQTHLICFQSRSEGGIIQNLQHLVVHFAVALGGQMQSIAATIQTHPPAVPIRQLLHWLHLQLHILPESRLGFNTVLSCNPKTSPEMEPQTRGSVLVRPENETQDVDGAVKRSHSKTISLIWISPSPRFCFQVPASQFLHKP